jgi:hypothetical protein
MGLQGIFLEKWKNWGVKCLTPVSTMFQLYHCGSVLLVEETRVPGENYQSAPSQSHNVVSSTPGHEQDLNLQC